MKNILLLLICIPMIGISQNIDYELEFNSTTQDYVEMLNTSVFIANKTAFSMSCWVNPQANTTHSGIMGFRNNVDADFYLLQLTGTNNLEARFRNSSGLNYDIVATNVLDFGQWQHLAFTYDGSNIHLYKNGVLISSTPANGVITQSTQSFRLGGLDYINDTFHMNGRLDEIRLWDVALSQTEINNWMCIPIDLTHPNYNSLMGYWKLNEGTGTAITDLSINGNNGTLFGGTAWQVSSSCLAGAVLCGDVNEDGSVDQIDVTDISSFIMGGLLPAFNLWAADVNCDGIINISDITILNSFISGTGSINCCSTTVLKTYVPDDNFEQALINLGYDNILDDSVITSNINTLTTLFIYNQNISDITGIEGFTSLVTLECNDNQISTLDLSSNIALEQLGCWNNQISSLNISNNLNLINLGVHNNQLLSIDVSNHAFLEALACSNNQISYLDVNSNLLLTALECNNNQISSLDVSQNINLIELYCSDNQITSLDISSNTSLNNLNCFNNQLTVLNLNNGNNIHFVAAFSGQFYANNNPNLFCITVDDIAWSIANWTVANGNIDSQHYFSNNCNPVTFDCTDSLEVTDVIIDNSNLSINIAIYNGYNYFLNYPYVAFTIDANGDTIQYGNMNLFGANNLVTTWYNYTLSSAISPAYPLTMYFVYSDGSLVTDTCILTYNSTPTDITYIKASGDRKLIRTVDVLGRENKGTRNEPLFYIYDDGTVEKKIIIE